MSHFYRIKPLKWEQQHESSYKANIINGRSMYVFNPHPSETVWLYSDGYHSQYGQFKTAEAAMKAAEKAYVKQLQQVLEEVTT